MMAGGAVGFVKAGIANQTGRETSGSETGMVLSETNTRYYRHPDILFPSPSQLASKQTTRTGRAGAVTKEGIDATLLQHVSSIE